MDSIEKSVRTSCANGHQLRVAQKLAGRSVPCPACGALVTVPSPEASLTDTGAFRILNDLESEFQEMQKQQPPKAPVRVERVAKPERTCPRCECAISKRDRVCPECRLILESGSRGFQQIYRAALRSLK